MRLIDADELLKAPFRIEGKFGGKYPFEAITVRMIEAAPTVEAAPVVHGRWVEENGIQICSNCGEEHEWEDYRASYCEDCGAKMDL